MINIQFKRKKSKDLLADAVEELLSSHSENEFYFLMGERLRGGNGKEYKNRDKNLPKEGSYEELEVNGSRDSRRIVVDMKDYSVYATRDHYLTMEFAGKPIWANQ